MAAAGRERKSREKKADKDRNDAERARVTSQKATERAAESDRKRTERERVAAAKKERTARDKEALKGQRATEKARVAAAKVAERGAQRAGKAGAKAAAAGISLAGRLLRLGWRSRPEPESGSMYAYTFPSYQATGNSGKNFPIKIGRTTQDVRQRVEQQLGTSNPERAIILDEWRCSDVKAEEARVHAALKPRQVKGGKGKEWFSTTPGEVKRLARGEQDSCCVIA